MIVRDSEGVVRDYPAIGLAGPGADHFAIVWWEGDYCVYATNGSMEALDSIRQKYWDDYQSYPTDIVLVKATTKQASY